MGLIGHIIRLRFLICPALYIFVAVLIRILPTNINFSTLTNPAKAILRAYFLRISKLFFFQSILFYSILVCTMFILNEQKVRILRLLLTDEFWLLVVS